MIVDVDCGTQWGVENSASDIFDAECDNENGTLTITAGQNTVEEELSGTITVMTLPSKIEFASITITQNAYGASEITVETNSWHVAAVGEEMTTTIAVTATGDWDYTNEAEWLTVEKTDDGITLTAAENEDTQERTAEVTLTCTDGITTDSEIVTVTQDGAAYITLSTEELTFSYTAGEADVEVESNFDWEYSLEENDWLTVARDEETGTLTLSYTYNNTGDTREATLAFTASDGAENIAEAQLVISQESVNPDALILEYNITSGNTQIKLPIASVTSPTVDWGDGTVETVTSANPSHTYADAGEYTVMVYDGKVTQLKSSTTASVYITGVEYLTAVTQWGTYALTSMQYAFNGCTNLTSLPEGAGPFSTVTNFQYAFSKTALTTLPEGIFDNCSKVTDFSYCFTKCPKLESLPAGLFAKCSKTTTFASVFSDCPFLAEIPGDLFSGCILATTFSSAFRYDVSIEKIPAELFTGCSAAQKFDYTFSFAADASYTSDYTDKESVLTEIPEGLFDKNTKVTTFDHVFYGCSSLKSIPKALFVNNTLVTTYGYAFMDCSSLTSVPEDLFGSQPAATTLSYVFDGCTSLTNDGLPTNLIAGCTAATTCQSFFYNCSSLTSLPVGFFDNCTKCTNFSYLFRGCTGLTTLDPDFFKPLTSATNFSYIFYGCEGLTEIPADLFQYNTAVTNYSYAFMNCTGLTSIPGTLFDTAEKVTTFAYAFSGCSSLTSLPSGLFANCLSLVTTCASVFEGCTKLTTLPDASKDEVLFGEAPKLATTTVMFSGCTSLTTVPDGLFDNLTAATSFKDVFNGCTALTTVPVSLFDKCLKIVTMTTAFSGCSALKGESPYTEVDGVKVHLYDRANYTSSGFTKISTYTNCFTGCTGLEDYDDILTAGWATAQ